MNLNFNILLPLLLTFINPNNAGPYVGTPPQMQQVQTVFEWQQLQFGFPSAQQQQQAIASGDLVVENATPIDVQPHYGGRNRFRLFVTIPRFATGIPYTLATVASEKGPKGQFLQAYPNYDFHNRQDRNCDKITSAFRVVINECNQMWVIDSGVIGTEQVCAPQLLLFDLNTDQMIHRFRFDSSLYIPTASLFITPISIVPNGKCQQSKLYIADVTRHGLVVYDRATNAAWRIENKFMYPDPDYGTHTIAGESFTLMDGIFSLVSDRRNLYFHPLASRNEYAVSLDLLNNRTMWMQNMESAQTSFINLGHRRSECGASAIDRSMNIYCVTFNPVQLIAWHVNTPYGPKNFATIPANARHLEFVSGMKVVASPNGDEELWMLSNRYQKIGAGTVNPNEPNFRILRRSLSDIQGGLFSGAFQSDLLNRLVFN